MVATLAYPAVQQFYNGTNQAHTSGTAFHTFDPSTARPLAVVHTASYADIDSAISSASTVFPSWSTSAPTTRARILHKAAALLRQRNDCLAEIETRDTGKPYSETSTVDVATAADVLEYFANLIGGGGLNGETVRLREDAWVDTKKKALGVCAIIGAWNCPLQIALWQSAPCLAAGNTIVYKPSEFAPLHAQRLAELYVEAGLPPGVFNVVYGTGTAVEEYLAAHSEIAKSSFAGQVSTGYKAATAVAADVKYVPMELGGKSTMIMLPDAELESAVDGAIMASFFNSGQDCTNGTRVFVPETILDTFEKRVVENMKYVRMGDPMNPSTNAGPLSSEVHLRKVRAAINEGTYEDHCRLLSGDGPSSIRGQDTNPDLLKGYWCNPRIFTSCRDDMKVVQKNVFGPIMCILPYGTTDPAWLETLIVRANATPPGIAAGVFTKDTKLAHKVVAKLQAQITWVNTWGRSPAQMSIGGWKMSGVRVERELEAWLKNKSTLVDIGGKVGSAFKEIDDWNVGSAVAKSNEEMDL